MGLCPSPQEVPDPSIAAVAGIQADQELNPFNYLINAASQMGTSFTDPTTGQTFDFTGLGQSDTARVVSDQMAKTLLEISKEKSPQIIAQRLAELKAADPQGYAARQQLFDTILAEANKNPANGLSHATTDLIQNELARGSGFADDKQKQEYQNTIRGKQARTGIILGNSKVNEEAQGLTQAGEALQNDRQNAALKLLESGSTPEDIAYRRMQQSVGNLGAFANGTTPEAQFGQVSAGQAGPVTFGTTGQNTNTFNPNAAGTGVNSGLQNWTTTQGWNNSQQNPWLAGASTALTAAGAIRGING